MKNHDPIQITARGVVCNKHTSVSGTSHPRGAAILSALITCLIYSVNFVVAFLNAVLNQTGVEISYLPVKQGIVGDTSPHGHAGGRPEREREAEYE